MAQTVTEKIIQAHAVDLEPGHEVRAGDMVTVRPFHVMTHDNTGAVIPKFRQIGAEKMADPSQPVFTLDHNVQDTSPANLEKYRAIETFASEFGVVFHPAGAGIGHQLMIENGFVHPGSLVVASDSHSNMYGALSALGTPVVRTDAAALWAGGTTWWQVPRSIRILLEGEPRPGVTGKDVIITLCGLYNSGEVLNAALEFTGDGIQYLAISERLTIANMTTEWGALVGWFPFDAATAAFLRRRAVVLAERGIADRLTEADIARWEADPPHPDEGAEYAAEVTLDLSTVTPHVAGPDSVGVVQSISAIEGKEISIDKAYLLSCTNARLDDLAQAAEVLEGRTVAEGVDLYVAAASAEIQAEAEGQGIWQELLDAGAIPLPRRAARGRRGRHLGDQPELQGPDGTSGRQGIPCLARRRRRVGRRRLYCGARPVQGDQTTIPIHRPWMGTAREDGRHHGRVSIEDRGARTLSPRRQPQHRWNLRQGRDLPRRPHSRRDGNLRDAQLRPEVPGDRRRG